MYTYKELGLVNTSQMFIGAYEGKYAVPALNFVSIEQFNAIVDACQEKRSPVILLASPNLHRQLGAEVIARLVQSGVDRLRHTGAGQIPVALHLDHGITYDQCMFAIKTGFSSVMIDGSALPFEENVAITRAVVTAAHMHDVTVEGELGVLSGNEEGESEVTEGNIEYTSPGKVEEFVKRTGVDSLAIAIGTSHGLVKMKRNPDGTLPELRFDILSDIQTRLPGFPIVLHGASSIPQEYVEMINKYGGRISNAIGIPEEQIAKAVQMAVCKVNIASDGWIAALALTRKILAEHPEAIDSRVFTLKVRPELVALYEHKMDLLGSVNKA